MPEEIDPPSRRRGRHLDRLGAGPRRLRRRAIVLGSIVVLAAALSGCAEGEVRTRPALDGASTSEPPVSPSRSSSSNAVESSLVPEGYTGRFRVRATVLQKDGGDAGRPALCSGVAQSLPPQCGGPPIEGWSWDAVPPGSFEAASGVRWGDYVLTGHFDGRAFALTEPPVPSKAYTGPTPSVVAEPTVDTPCPEPAGGWRPVDASTATTVAFEKAMAAARARADFGGLWVDQRLEPGRTPSLEEANDPTRFVLNVSTTGDIAAVAQSLRADWGGALCVSRTAHSYAELERVNAALVEQAGTLGLLSFGVSEVSGRVDVVARVATIEQQRRFDEQYGPGVVRLAGAFWPLDR